MSELLDELVKKRKQADLEYRKYLEEIIALSKQVKNPSESQSYPNEIDTRGKQALYDNLGQDAAKAMSVHDAIMASRSDDWRAYFLREKAVKKAVAESLPGISEQELKDLFEIIKNQNEY
jgi:type I restriction enzyme R subunit